MKLNVCEPKPCCWRRLAGMPRSLIRVVIWCSDSGLSDQKSQAAVALRRLDLGSRFCVWMKSGNFNGSRMKKTGVLLPTRSQLPSSV
ncbi:hypothetical protein D9M68_823390 [compost metagenome]